MAGTSVIYYPPTTGYPYLVVTFLPDRSLQTTPLTAKRKLRPSLIGLPHRLGCLAELRRVAGRFRSRGLRYGTQLRPVTLTAGPCKAPPFTTA